MGNFISNNNLYLLLKRSATRYNVQNRAHKELKRQESSPVSAPKYDAGIIDYQKSMLGNKSYQTEVTNKNEKLQEYLKDIYVTSHDEISEESKNKQDKRPLPIKRTTDFFEFGYKESKIIPIGRISLMQAMKFITEHRSNASIWTVEKISFENKLKKDVVDDILKYFYVYEVFNTGQTDQNLIDGNYPKMLSARTVETKRREPEKSNGGDK